MKNLYSINDLKKIINIKSINNIKDDCIFDFLRIISINNHKEEKESSNILFFPITLDGDYITNRWIIKPINLGEKVNDIIEHNPNYTYMLEPKMVLELKNKDVKYIEVDSINDSIERIYLYALSKSKAKTIAITGSTGKTTTIGLLEHVLSSKYNVLRIYSKRITPIILKAWIINLLTEDIDYIVLEMSLYYQNHVETLANILPPSIAAIINLDNAHLGNDGMQKREDLAISKAKILKNAKIGYINKNNDILKKLSLEKNNLYLDNEFICSTKLEQLRCIDFNSLEVKDNKFLINNTLINPYILSELSKIQIALTYDICINLGLSHENICPLISSYSPVENRINKQVIMNREIIFDGDVTNASRIRSLASSLYNKKVLVIRKFGSSENYVDCNDVISSFNNFDKVYLFNDVEYFQELKNHDNIIIVDNNEFIKDLDDDIMIIYHYSAYFRTYNEFDENNLNTIDKTIYPILYK